MPSILTQYIQNIILQVVNIFNLLMGYFTFLFSYEVFEIWCLHSVQPHLKCLTAAVSRAGTIDFWTKYFFAVEAALCIIEALAASLDASSIPILQL